MCGSPQGRAADRTTDNSPVYVEGCQQLSATGGEPVPPKVALAVDTLCGPTYILDEVPMQVFNGFDMSVLPFWATPQVHGCLAPEVVHPAAFTFKLPDTVSFAEANVFDRAVAMIASGKVDLKPPISATFPFDESVQAFERAAEGRPADVKLQVKL
jgi:hypothetical protein